MKLSVKSPHSYEDWERGNNLIKEAFFSNSNYNPKQNIKILTQGPYIIGSFELSESNDIAIVNHFNIMEEYRNQGLGTIFLSKINQYLKYKKFKKVSFVSHPNLRDFYIKNGFNLIKEEEYLYFELFL